MVKFSLKVACLLLVSGVAVCQPLPPDQLADLVRECAPQVSPDTMLRLIDHESKGNAFVIGVNAKPAHKAYYPKTKEEAIGKATRLLEQGHNIDMGLGQINSANLNRLGLTVEQVFDPCKNVRAAAVVLEEAFKRASREESDPQQALSKALSIYNTGKLEAGISNGYVAKVREYSVPSLSANGLAPAEQPEVVKVKAFPKWDVFGGQRTAAPIDAGQAPVEEATMPGNKQQPIMVFGQD